MKHKQNKKSFKDIFITAKSGAGFTLIEVVITVAIFSLIVYGISALVSSILINSNQQSNLLVNNDSARRVAFGITRELRNATTSATGSYPLVTAGAQQIIFYSDTGATINRFRYFLQDGILYKGVIKPSGNPPVYDLGQEVVTIAQRDVANGANPIFYYYTGVYDGVADNPLSQPVNVTQTKFVKVDLSVYKKGGRTNTQSYTVTAGGTIRNLKTNLGE